MLSMPNIDACYRSIAADPSAQHEGQLSASNCRSGSHISWSLLAGSSPSLPDGSNPSAAIVQSASDVQCSRLLKTTVTPVLGLPITFSKATLVSIHQDD